MQTLVVNSPFREALMDPTMSGGSQGFARLIDWNRGSPYTFRQADFQELMASDCMFARKFDETVDGATIDEIGAQVCPTWNR